MLSPIADRLIDMALKSATSKMVYHADKHKEEIPPAPLPPRTTANLIWDDLAHWQRDNQFIQTGYRAPTNSLPATLASLFRLHNETVNIWTHLLPALLSPFVYLRLTNALRRSVPAYSDQVDGRLLAVFFGSFACCLGLSAVYHLLGSHSEQVARWTHRLDYVGITVLIWGSFVPSLCYGLQEHRVHRDAYLAMISVLAVACVAASVVPRFAKPDFRSFRASIFVFMGLSALAPVIHSLTFMSAGELDHRMSLRHMIVQGALYITGAVLYAARIPERWYPRRFDLVGSSHQIFHILVLVAAVVHLRGIVLALYSAKLEQEVANNGPWSRPAVKEEL